MLKLGPGQCYDSPVTPRARSTGVKGAEVGKVLRSHVCGLCCCLGETSHNVTTCREFSTSKSCHTTCLNSMSTFPGLSQTQK